MTIKWTMESIWTAVAVVISVIGGVWTTSYRWGQVNAHVTAVETEQAEINAKVKAHDDALQTLATQNARIEQKLDDVNETVHDIQGRVKNGRH